MMKSYCTLEILSVLVGAPAQRGGLPLMTRKVSYFSYNFFTYIMKKSLPLPKIFNPPATGADFLDSVEKKSPKSFAYTEKSN